MGAANIAVVGAGTMGAGIAQLAATRGSVVHLIDVSGDAVQRGVEGIAKRLDRSLEKGRIDASQHAAILDRIIPHPSLDGLGTDDLGEVELAIEAAVERLDIKQEIFRHLERATSRDAVLATNTSSLSITKIARAVEHPSRVVGMHFFNPAVVMPLVEVIAGEASTTAAVDAAFDAASGWGKIPVRVKDTPGFIVNRVARGYYLEALRMLGEGVAGVDEIDAVMRTHGGFKMGPFELVDLVGLDVNFAVSTSVWEQLGKPARLTPHEIQQSLVNEGHLGRKTSRGFYSYQDKVPIPAVPVDRQSFELSPLLADVLAAFAVKAGAVHATKTEQYIFGRILGAILNEAALAFTDDIASSDDIDTAMIRGTNYPKGPLAWSDEIGHSTVRGLLALLNEQASDGRYEPAALFCQ